MREVPNRVSRLLIVSLIIKSSALRQGPGFNWYHPHRFRSKIKINNTCGSDQSRGSYDGLYVCFILFWLSSFQHPEFHVFKRPFIQMINLCFKTWVLFQNFICTVVLWNLESISLNTREVPKLVHDRLCNSRCIGETANLWFTESSCEQSRGDVNHHTVAGKAQTTLDSWSSDA